MSSITLNDNDEPRQMKNGDDSLVAKDVMMVDAANRKEITETIQPEPSEMMNLEAIEALIPLSANAMVASTTTSRAFTPTTGHETVVSKEESSIMEAVKLEASTPAGQAITAMPMLVPPEGTIAKSTTTPGITEPSNFFSYNEKHSPLNNHRDEMEAEKESDRNAIDHNMTVDEEDDSNNAVIKNELAFLVTHWLANYDNTKLNGNPNNDVERKAAIRKIKLAAADLASAFSCLGVFGENAIQNAFIEKEHGTWSSFNNHQVRNRTYTDLKRQWNVCCPSNQLETLIQAAHAASYAADAAVAPEYNTNLTSVSSGQIRILPFTNLVMAANESIAASIHNPKNGRTLQDAIDLETNTTIQDEEERSMIRSSLHAPVLMMPSAIGTSHKDDEKLTTNKNGKVTTKSPSDGTNSIVSPINNGFGTITVSSSYRQLAYDSAAAFRTYFDLRIKYQQDEAKIKSLQRSLEHQKITRDQLIQRRNQLLSKQSQHDLNLDVAASKSNGTLMQYNNDVLMIRKVAERNGNNVIEKNHSNVATNNVTGTEKTSSSFKSASFITEMGEIEDAEQNCERVIAQLDRQLPALISTHKQGSEILSAARNKSEKLYQRSKIVLQNYRDPPAISSMYNYATKYMKSSSLNDHTATNNRLLFNLQLRQMGCVDRCIGMTMPRSMGRTRLFGSMIENQKSLFYNRFSYAATINTHIDYPVYCLRFDRTGRYFITGADDYLVRVFCIGENVVVKKKSARKIDPSTYIRGAVLVCTLRGHAGVINDIAVSSDNSFLATASDDCDCRVWGLKDGCPVAILRGHEGGANMVSWSTLTPYRLVTTGADGLARIWDIREACLKRYGTIIGKRSEYLLSINGKFMSAPNTDGAEPSHQQNSFAQTGESMVSTDRSSEQQHPEQLALSLPPLPPLIPLPPLPPAANSNNQGNFPNNDNDAQLGRFVANDMIDEGVKLVSKLQHGASLEDRANASGTTSRCAAVKVICVARCPHGGHFATGSDDGICRIWKDEDDSLADKIDAEHIGRQSSKLYQRRPTRKSSDPLLVTLKGHLSAITDLVYSSSGDRLLSASQKDGAVRIWSWSQDPCHSSSSSGSGTPPRGSPGGNISHIHIKLTNPRSTRLASTASAAPRRRMNRSANSNISCDVAVWIQDDSKIVTSQSELVKSNGSEIVPGSHFLFLWDSFTGNCLLGIAGAHSMQCPVLISHPTNPSIMCSAGADGIVKLWNWETCQCLLMHSNIADFGPLDASERGKHLGYLDGSFSPDGTILVLTDDSGRITIFDCNAPKKEKDCSSLPPSCPGWMKEQYFSNDYYDVIYDESGYCVERGSEQPPHLAPRGSRCSHTGAPFEEGVTEAFSHLFGPMPLPDDVSRWNREEIRRRAEIMIEKVNFARGNTVREYDPNTTILIQHGEQQYIEHGIEVNMGAQGAMPTLRSGSSQNRSAGGQNRAVRMLSSNYRWGNAYEEALRAADDDRDLESDDEDFQLNEGRVLGTRDTPTSVQTNSVDFDHETDEDLSPQVRRSSSFAAALSGAAPSRASSRAHRPKKRDESDDETTDIAEYLSTNNDPSGPFVVDYLTYLFRLPPNKGKVFRSWVRRKESLSSYEGRKKYTPQIGDEVVYIPRAYFDTISSFPCLSAPWQSWPDSAVWPVVECRIVNIRYRFPFKDFFKSNDGKGCRSVVAILTLEVIGIPELSSDRIFSWPSISFVTPSKKHVFEITLFENTKADFVIPSSLYKTRITLLENAVPRANHDRRPKIEVFYSSQNSQEEDGQFDVYPGQLIGIDETDEPAGKLKGSGYGSIEVEWERDGTDHVHPWEVNVRSSHHQVLIDRPRMSEFEKKIVVDAIEKIKKIDKQSFFLFPVDVNVYSDYLSRVEVPMDLTFILERLDSDYYANKLSVAADVRLILDNCIKYNGEGDELSVLAREMLETFEASVLSADERLQFDAYAGPISGGNYASVQQDGVLLDIHSSLRSRISNTNTTLALQSRASVNSGQDSHHPQTRSNSALRLSPESLALSPGRSSRAMQSNRGGRRNTANRRERRTNLFPQGGPDIPRGQNTLTSDPISSDSRANTRRNRSRRTNSGRAPGSSGSQYDTRSDIDATLSSARDSRRDTEAHGSAVDSPIGSDTNRRRSNRSSSRNLGNDNMQSVRDSPLVRIGQAYSPQYLGESAVDPMQDTSLRTRSHFLRQDVRESQETSNRVRKRQTATPSGAQEDKEMSPSGRARTTLSSRTQMKDDDHEKETAGSRRNRLEHSDSLAQLEFGGEDEDADFHSESCDDESDIDLSSDNSNLKRKPTPRIKIRLDKKKPARPTRSCVKVVSKDNDDSSKEEDSEGSSEDEFRNTNRSKNMKRQKRLPVADNDPQTRSSQGTRLPRSKSRNVQKSEICLQGRGSRTTAAAPVSYRDPSESEFERSESEASSDITPTTRHKKKVDYGRMNGKRKGSSKSRQAKKQKVDSALDVKVPEWQEINPRLIKQIGNDIVNRLRKLDKGGIFAVPVLEKHPYLQGEYTKVVSQPMDFRTIIKDRLPDYKSIKQLREDLILVFHNCILFNGAGDSASKIARNLLDSMHETFIEVCKKHNITFQD